MLFLLIAKAHSQQNWIQPVYSLYFNEIQMTSSIVGYAGGADGKTFKTIDGGLSWQYMKINNKNDIKGLYFINETTGWICSGREIYFTSDGGANWSKKYTASGQLFLNDIYAFENNIWVSCFSNKILNSTDNGNTWQIKHDGNTADPFQKIFFHTNQNGWALGNTGIKNTTDGGNTWNVKYSTSTNSLFSFHFNNTNTGFITGSGGLLLKTSDGGETWIGINTGYTDEFYDITADPAGNLYICGSSGKIIKSNNEGLIWNETNTGTYNFLFSISCAANDQVFAAGADALILKSTNGGGTYANASNTFSITPNIIFNKIYFLSLLEGWAAGSNGTLYKTTNGGINWTKQETGSSSNITGLYFINELTGWLATSDGQILNTGNGGTTWSLQSTNSGVNFKNIVFANENTGWATTSNGNILKTTNGGTTWVNPTTDFIGSIIKIKINSINNLKAVSSIGKVYTSTNGGVNWIETGAGNNSFILSDVFILPSNELYLWATSTTGIIINSINGGNTWNLQSNSTITQDDLLGITFYDNLIGWAVGSNGTILKTLSGGISWVKDDSLTAKNLETITVKDGNVMAAGRSGTIIKNNSLIALSNNNIQVSGFFINNNSIKLNWKINDISLVKNLELERSEDGILFEKIGSINKDETSYLDDKIIHLQNDNIYYRIKILNQSLSYQFSPIVKISKTNMLGTEFSVLENPAKNSFRLKLISSKETTAHINIYKLTGELVLSIKQNINKGTNVISLSNTATLPRANYFVTINLNSKTYTNLIIKE